MATTTTEETSTGLEGAWNVTWRGGAIAPQSGVLTLTTAGESLVVHLETEEGAGSCEAVVDGDNLSWTIALGEDLVPLQFAAVLEGHRLSGQVARNLEGTVWEMATLEGSRVGFDDVEARSREGVDALADTLIACGVEYVFGYCCAGSMVPAVLDRIPNMAARNELSAAWMSYGYNRVKRRAASGTLVWCVGALHASPVVHAAKLDSTPFLFMTVEAAGSSWDVRDILQDGTDLYSALRPLSKYIERIVDAQDLPLAVRQAVIASSTGKFGPAVLCLTPEATNERTSVKTEEFVLPSPPAATEESVSEVLEMIANAKNPVLLAGAGIHLADARSELRAFVEAAGIPVVSSGPGGRGVLPDDHPLYAGDMTLWGYFDTGTDIAEQADLWIAVGFSFSQTATKSWSVAKPDKVIHVDVESAQLGRIFQPSLGIVADAKIFLGQLNRQLKASGAEPADYAGSPRVAEIAKTKRDYFDKLASFGGDPIMPAAIGQVLAEEVPEDTILVNDEGFMIPGMVFRGSKFPSGFASPLGFHYASLGSTLPVAIGAKLAAPDRLVVSVGGDSGFYYDCSDLSILAEHDLKVVVILINNGGLYGGSRGRESGVRTNAIQLPHWVDQPDTDFATVARGFGVDAERVERSDELAPAIRRAIAADGPYFVEVRAGASTLHLMMAARGAEMAAGSSHKFGHGDSSLEGSWPS